MAPVTGWGLNIYNAGYLSARLVLIKDFSSFFPRIFRDAIILKLNSVYRHYKKLSSVKKC